MISTNLVGIMFIVIGTCSLFTLGMCSINRRNRIKLYTPFRSMDLRNNVPRTVFSYHDHRPCMVVAVGYGNSFVVEASPGHEEGSAFRPVFSVLLGV